jgi:hypothetical protein
LQSCLGLIGLADLSAVAGERSERLAEADVAQLAERVLGKDEVTSSILVIGSTRLAAARPFDIAQGRREPVNGGSLVAGRLTDASSALSEARRAESKGIRERRWADVDRRRELRMAIPAFGELRLGRGDTVDERRLSRRSAEREGGTDEPRGRRRYNG